MASHEPSSTSHRTRTTVIGSFNRMEEIGRGSFATVYKAIHTSRENVQSLVAIKSVNLGKLNKKLKDNLTSEISILKGLHHPHIVALIDCKESSSHIHLVMEYVALGDLSYFIKKRDTIKDNPMVADMMVKYPNPRSGGLNEVVVRHFLKQLSSALQFLRERNLIHRDVKPQNLLLNPSPEYFAKVKPETMPYLASTDSLEPVCGIRSLPMLKIADFGFARSLPSTSLAETLCGSPLYMAPEILRYEKYDAKADLWSVGTVLYEMITSKPPFRASNHVELLRKIEKGEDRIKFPDDVAMSDQLKKLIRALLKRDPKERMSFQDFFANEIIVSAIPGLAASDRQGQALPPESSNNRDHPTRSRTDSTGVVRPGSRREMESPYSDRASADDDRAAGAQTPRRPSSGASLRPSSARRSATNESTPLAAVDDRPTTPTAQKIGLPSHTTAPSRRNTPPAMSPMERKASNAKSRPGPSLIGEQVKDQERERALRREQEKTREQAAQDVAFERDYVLVEKRAVEMNAFADELEASPRLTKAVPQTTLAAQAGVMIRRATNQGQPTSTTGAQTSASRAVQIASGRPRADALHYRQSSYERRYAPSPNSASSAISKALNMASGRLFGIGFSPPVSLGRGGRSPPTVYNPFPTYPAAQNSLVVISDGGKSMFVDEDTKFVQSIEEVATRSDVVYGFAEVKYRQLTPTLPSAQAGPGMHNPGPGTSGDDGNDVDEGLTIEAVVIVSEEALVLYVKALSLLAKSMDIAGRWWARKNRGEVLGDFSSTRSSPTSTNTATEARMNNVVQWIRGRFNEVLEKAELVRLKLIDNQRRLPEDHPSHPSNLSAATTSSTGMGTSADHVVVSSGITAEKLMYDRALEMSRSAAINELTGEDLVGCEISYVTAIRMLEAVLESDDDIVSRNNSASSTDKSAKDANYDDSSINGMELEDRKTVKKLVASIRSRLAALRKKLQVIQKRASAPSMTSPPKPATPVPHRPAVPSVATTPPM